MKMAHIKHTYKYYYIYKILNLINKKHYIGFHATNKEYDKDIYFGSSKTLDEAIKKYGIENFIMGILEYVNEDNWKERETYWIKEMKSHITQEGYNLTYGGDGTLGLKMKPESCEKIRTTCIGRKQTENTKRKKGDSLKGRPKTEEHKKKIALSNTGKKCPEYVKDRVSKANKGNKYREGKHHTEKTKAILKEKSSINNTGEKNGMYKHVYTEETLEKLKTSANTMQMCPHCRNYVKRAVYNHYHGNNCKLKLIN